MKISYEYDSLNRLLVQKTIGSTGECIAKYTYTIGKNGERTNVLEEVLAGTTETEYTYDKAGRLTGEIITKTESGSAETQTAYEYAYDKVGNRISKSANAGGTPVVTEYTYNSRNQLISESTNGQETRYSYDANGNLTDTYAYNAYGELTEKNGETENHFLYTGEYYDGTTNLYYLRARYMNPGTETFISMDSYQGDL